jgi:hypothetical protein
MQKPKSFRPWQPEQTILLPPSPREWLSQDQQAYFLLDLVDELDLSEILIPASSRSLSRITPPPASPQTPSNLPRSQ